METQFNFENLPEVFGIMCNMSHPRWKEFIRLMNQVHFSGIVGDSTDYFYGVDESGNFDYWSDIHLYFDDKELTLDEFFEIIEMGKIIENYQIY